MSKALKISLIVLVVVIIVGAVYIKYIKPKMDERKEIKRLKEADLIAKSSKTVSPDNGETMVSAIVSQAEPILVGVGGTVVKAQ